MKTKTKKRTQSILNSYSIIRMGFKHLQNRHLCCRSPPAARAISKMTVIHLNCHPRRCTYSFCHFLCVLLSFVSFSNDLRLYQNTEYQHEMEEDDKKHPKQRHNIIVYALELIQNTANNSCVLVMLSDGIANWLKSGIHYESFYSSSFFFFVLRP